MVISTATYERVALEDDDHIWELENGQLRRKPDMSQEHNDATMDLLLQLAAQVDTARYALRQNMGHLAAPPGHSYVPDVFILPRDFKKPRASAPACLETYTQPMPFLCEVWSPSTGDYDTDAKLPYYQARGDLEIWRVHPYEQTVIAWRRQPDGSYLRELVSGTVALAAVPDIRVDIDRLFQ